MPLEERDPADLTPEEAQEVIRRQRVDLLPRNDMAHTDNPQARLVSIENVKEEHRNAVKRKRSTTAGPSRSAKVARTSSGQAYVNLEDTDDEDVVQEQAGPGRKRPDAEIEVIDLLD